MSSFKFKVLSLKFFLLAIFFISGCEREIDLNPHKVHWDRDMCIRCKMVISDRSYVAQVTDPTNGKTYFFDDIGCLILWFKEDDIKWQDQTIIWVADEKSGEWIEAKKAKWSTNSITPMGYGFAAHKNGTEPKDTEIIDYDEVVKRVIKIGR
jgi:hypothetical protein